MDKIIGGPSISTEKCKKCGGEWERYRGGSWDWQYLDCLPCRNHEIILTVTGGDIMEKRELLGGGDPNDESYKELKPNGQQKDYIVLSAEERASGYVRPVRKTYVHVGVQPKYPLRDLTEEEKVNFSKDGYVKYEEYPESESPMCGKFWTEKQLKGGCGAATTMNIAFAQTYAKNPHFYGSTFCCNCGAHLPVGEFVWDGTDQKVGS